MKNPMKILIVCINLVDEEERYQKMCAFRSQSGLPIQILRVKRHPLGGKAGCFTSHLRVIRIAWRKQYDKLVVLEDDIKPSPSFDAATFLNTVAECRGEYCQLGYGLFPKHIIPYLRARHTHSSEVTYSARGTHAYVLDRRGMKRVIGPRFVGLQGREHLDKAMVKWFGQSGGSCHVPLLFTQDYCVPSSNDWGSAEGLRRAGCMESRFMLFHKLSLLKAAVFRLDLRSQNSAKARIFNRK